MGVVVVVGGNGGWECMSLDCGVVKCTRAICSCCCSWFVFYSLWFGSMFVRKRNWENNLKKGN